MLRFCLASLLLCMSLASVLAQEEPPKRPKLALLVPKLLKIAEGDSAELRLLKERHNAATLEVNAANNLYEIGKVMLDVVYDAAERLVTAKLDLSKTSEERAAILTDMVEFARMMETHTKSNYEAGLGTEQQYQQSIFVRADWELKLLREKKAARPAK